VTYHEQMTATRRNDTDPAPSPDGDPRWANLADLILIIAREIQFLGYRDPEAVPLTQSEGMVMRYLQDHPGTPPSQLADATGLQRTNLSAVLRGLERKGLAERRGCPDDLRRAAIHPTERGKRNYALVRQEWAAVVSAAADHDTADLDEALTLLRKIGTSLTASRPPYPGRPAALM
jgi:DNA-binding MarR family transcriptional regulator